MYFRRKKTPSGQVLQLLESYRNLEGQPRQRVVLSLGNARVPEPHWKEIATVVEKRLYGQGELFPGEHPAAVAEWADTIVRRVDLGGRWQPLGAWRAGGEERGEEAPAEITVDGVRLEKVSHTDTASLGAELVGWHIWNELGMGGLLEQLGFNEAQRQAAAASVVNRLVEPVSEHKVREWLKTSALPELVGAGVLQGGKDRFYRVSDRLWAHQERIEAHLRHAQRRAFSLERTVFLYDLTNTYFEGTAKGNGKAKRGRSKHKRDDCPQVVIGMVFDQQGFELAHQVFEGNRNDSTTLVEVVRSLERVVQEERDLFTAGKPLVVVDAGVATRKNLRRLRQSGFDYLVNDSRRGRIAYREAFSEREGFARIEGREGKAGVEVRMIRDPVRQADPEGGKGGEEQEAADWLVLCRSEARRGKEQAIRSKAEERFLEAIVRLGKRVETGRLKQKEKIERAIGRLGAKHPRVGRFYSIEIEENGPAPGAAAGSQAPPPSYRVSWRRKDEPYQEQEELLGCYVLRTSKEGLTAEQLWGLYMTLTRAEDGFRALKSDLGLRPNHHQTEDRSDAHVFISVLAYHILHYILYTLRGHGDTRSWATLKQVLKTHCYTTTLLPTNRGETHRIRKAGEPDERQKTIYRRLGVTWSKLPVKRSSIPARAATTL
jgi:transposase